MKNSAWYHKLWLKKLSELPLKEDSDSAWAGMKDILDKQLPVSSPGGHSGGTGTSAAKPFMAKLIALAGYALPVAAAIGVTTYFAAPLVIQPKQAERKKKQESHLRIDTVNHKASVLLTDLLKDTAIVKENAFTDSVAAATDLIAGRTAKGKTEEGTVQGNQHMDIRSSSASKATVQIAGKSFNSGHPVSASSPASVLEIANGTAAKKENSVNPLPGGGVINMNGSPEKTTEKLTADKPGKSSNSKAAAAQTSKKDKTNKAPKLKTTDITTPDYDFGLESGVNTGKNNSLYLGAFGSYRIRTRLLLNAGIRINTSTEISGSYTSKPFSVPGDSTSHRYKVSDTRKVMVLNVPLTIEYRISGRISVNAGPVISFPLSQTSIKTGSELLSDTRPANLYLDSLRKRTVDSTLTHTTLNKINLGITGGVSIRMKQFYIEAKYLQNLSPYKVNSSLGGYQQSYRSFQLGIRYRFKR